MASRYWALLIGVVYLLVGIVGFVPALRTAPAAGSPHVSATAGYGLLLGLFPVNALHDLVHIVIGLAGIAAFATLSSSIIYSRILFVLYGLLAVAGFMPSADTLNGLAPIYGADIPLHAATAVVSSYFGWVAPAETYVAPVGAAHH